jgi:tRNA(Ile)-lysidine synthase
MPKAAKKETAPSFLKKVRETVSHYDMLRGGEKVLIAVSGGPDSMCMLKVLLDLAKTSDLVVVVANMDHGIRGAESERDSEFVRKITSQHGLEFIHRKVAIKGVPSGGRSIEELAREKRYAFLLEAAERSGCQVIATGHTLDDQAETVLMRIISGSSPSALGGVQPVRYEGDIRIIRPLIRVDKKEALAYLHGARWDFVEDSTNKELDYFRNRVRLEIMPFLEKYNPKLKRALVNLSDGVREELEFIRLEKEKMAVFHGQDGGRVIACICDMVLQPRPLRREIFKELLRKAGGNIKKLTYRHWMDMDRLLRSGSNGGSLDLPGDIRITRTRDEMVFEKRPRSA